MNYPASCTCMINENPFSTLHSSAPPVAIPLLEPRTKGRRGERRREKLKERSLWLKKGDESRQQSHCSQGWPDVGSSVQAQLFTGSCHTTSGKAKA